MREDGEGKGERQRAGDEKMGENSEGRFLYVCVCRGRTRKEWRTAEGMKERDR